MSVILRCERSEPRRMATGACGHPSRRARKSAHLRVNAIAFIPGMTSIFVSSRRVGKAKRAHHQVPCAVGGHGASAPLPTLHLKQKPPAFTGGLFASAYC